MKLNDKYEKIDQKYEKFVNYIEDTIANMTTTISNSRETKYWEDKDWKEFNKRINNALACLDCLDLLLKGNNSQIKILKTYNKIK